MYQIRLAIGEDGHLLQPSDVTDIRPLLEGGSSLVWIDIDRDDLEDLLPFRDLVYLHPLAYEDAQSLRQRPIFSRYGETFFLVMYELIQKDHDIRAFPISFFVGHNYVVTARDIERSTLDDVADRWMQHRDNVPQMDAGFLLFTMLDAIVDNYFPILEHFGEGLEDLEDAIEEGAGERVQGLIHLKRRKIMELRRTLAPEREVLNELLRRETPLVSDETMAYLHDVYDHLLRVLDWLDSYRELASALFETQLAMASHKLDKVMRTLTVASIILMVSALIAGIYGMNFQHMPELAWYYGYPMAIGMMVAAALTLLWLFRRRGWL